MDIEKLKKRHDELWAEIHTDSVYNLYSKYEDAMKKTNQNKLPITTIVFGIFCVVILIGFLINNIILALGILLILTILMMLVLLPVAKKYSPNFKKYREELIPQLLESTGFIKMVNKTGTGISVEEYKNIGFADGNFNEFYSGYNIVTTKGEQEIKISNIKVRYYEEEYYSDTNKKTITDITKYEGIVIQTKFEKNILDGYIHIFTDKNGEYSNKEDKILMDSTLFENKFDVYSSDKVKTFMILTPYIMEKILEKIEEQKTKMEIVISNNMIAIRIYDNQTRFTGVHINGENKLLRDNVINDIKYIYDLNEFVGKIVEEINDII